MKILGFDFHFHKWNYIYEKHKNVYMGRVIVDYTKEFRVCSVCNKVEQQDFYGVDWCELSPNRSEVVIERMINDSYTTEDGKIVLNKMNIKPPRDLGK